MRGTRKTGRGLYADGADDRDGHHQRARHAWPFPASSAPSSLRREAVLKEDLHVMRAAIDSYTMDKQKAPQSLDDLIQNGYLRSIPEDPMTHSRETWVTDTSDSLQFGRPDRPGHRRHPLRIGRDRVRRATLLGLVKTTKSKERPWFDESLARSRCWCWWRLFAVFSTRRQQDDHASICWMGKPGGWSTSTGVFVRANHHATVHGDWVKQNEDGTSELKVPADASVTPDSCYLR